jgi:hypothetical protein
MLFGLLQQPGGRWLRDVQHVSRAFDGARLHHRVEDFDVAYSHGE